MNTDKAIKKIEKYLCVIVVKLSHYQYGFTYDDKMCTITDSSGEAHSFHIKRSNEHTYAMSDYFPGYYLKNVSQFLQALKPAPMKYPAGTLIKGRKNKRAVRRGISERTGVVISVKEHGSYDILFCGDEHIRSYPYERDLEVVK